MLLKRNLNHDDIIIQSMATSMLRKFDKYWSEYSDILSLAIVLDPHVKLVGIKYTFTTLDPSNSQEKIEDIKRRLYDIFIEYNFLESSSSSTQVEEISSTSRSHNNVPSSAPNIFARSSSTSLLEAEMTDNDVFGVRSKYLRYTNIYFIN